MNDIVIKFTHKDFEKVADIEVSSYKFSNAEMFLSKLLQNGFDSEDISDKQKAVMEYFGKEKTLEFIFRITPEGKIIGEIKRNEKI